MSKAVVQRGECSFTDKARIAHSNGAAGLLIMNNMGSSDSVVRMDMKNLIYENIQVAAISYSYAATQTLLAEYIKIRREENPLYMMIQKSDNNPIFWPNDDLDLEINTDDEMEIWVIVLITLAAMAVILAMIAFCCCCKPDAQFQCVCCCTCCECRGCIQSRQTSDESDNTDETPVDRIDEV